MLQNTFIPLCQMILLHKKQWKHVESCSVRRNKEIRLMPLSNCAACGKKSRFIKIKKLSDY